MFNWNTLFLSRISQQSQQSQQPPKSLTMTVNIIRISVISAVFMGTSVFQHLHAQEETAEALQAKVAGLEKQITAIRKDRDALYDQLSAAIDDLEGLEQKLTDTDTGRSHIRNKYLELSNQTDSLKSQVIEQTRQLDSLSAQIETGRANNEAESQRLVDSSLAQIKSALAERDQARQQLSNAEQLADSSKQSQEEQMQRLADSSFAQIQNALNQRDETNEKLGKAEEKILELQARLSSTANAVKEQNSVRADEVDQSVVWSSKLSKSLANQYRGLANVEVTQLDGNRVSIRIGNAGLFGSGASGLSKNGRNLLSRIGDALVAQTDAKILIIGHTDNIPVGANSTYVDNTDLSNRRARKALQHLGEVVGIPFERLASTGLADTIPIATNSTAEGRAQNRRIELELTQVR